MSKHKTFRYRTLISYSGLGLGICIRLVDDFLKARSASESLTIIFTTRGARKSADTLNTLQAHLSTTHPTEKDRILFQPENVDLTSLLSVQTLAVKLLDSDVPQLDAIILNAGIGGWLGLNWPLAIATVLTDVRRATTWPTFKIGAVGALTQPQLPAKDGRTSDEPPLGEVFCANVFGHYMLAHWLMPLLWACSNSRPGRIIWISSIEASQHHFDLQDLQGVRTSASYEHTKRLSDYLALSATDPASQQSVESFLDPEDSLTKPISRPRRARPTIHTSHPGIVTTTIVALYWIVHQAWLLVSYASRWLGSPWATVTPYVAAVSTTWLALVSEDELAAKEKVGGGRAAKWGSASNRSGQARVEMTDTEGWGLTGSGQPFADIWWGGPGWWGGGSLGRAVNARDATREDVEDFIATGARAWKGMEELRVDWEQRLAAYGRSKTSKQ